MEKLERRILDGIENALESLGAASGSYTAPSLQLTRPEFEGHLTLVCFPYTRLLGLAPEAVGKAIGEYMVAHFPEIPAYSVVKGFLNLTISDSAWCACLWNFVQSGIVNGFFPRPQKVMVEFSSPNTNKPLHLGHLRNIFLGASLSEILRFAGHTVVRTNLINDRGIHICKSMVAYLREGNGETPSSCGIKGDHLAGKYYVRYDQIFRAEVKELTDGGMGEEEAGKEAPVYKEAQKMLRDWEAGNPGVLDLWKTMNGWVYDGFGQSYQRMGVAFDQYYYESETYLLGKDMVDEGLASGAFYRKEDGSVWIDLSAEGLDQKLLLRSDGTSVYMTQDLGTADLKFRDHGADRSVYVVGNEQDYHFQVLFHILRRLGRSYAPGLHHLSYGMVDLPSGKMKSREGTVVDADEIMDEMVETARNRTRELGKIAELEDSEKENLYEVLGLGAIKYFLLKVDPAKRMLFNPEESIELQGNTATAIQYTHARISAICRKAAQQNIGLRLSHLPARLAASERDLIRHLLRFVSHVEEAAREYSPAVIAHYLYETSRLYNAFFARESIFQAEEPDLVRFRVALSYHTGEVIRTCGRLLGIIMPERM